MLEEQRREDGVRNVRLMIETDPVRNLVNYCHRFILELYIQLLNNILANIKF